MNYFSFNLSRQRFRKPAWWKMNRYAREFRRHAFPQSSEPSGDTALPCTILQRVAWNHRQSPAKTVGGTSILLRLEQAPTALVCKFGEFLPWAHRRQQSGRFLQAGRNSVSPRTVVAVGRAAKSLGRAFHIESRAVAVPSYKEVRVLLTHSLDKLQRVTKAAADGGIQYGDGRAGASIALYDSENERIGCLKRNILGNLCRVVVYTAILLQDGYERERPKEITGIAIVARSLLEKIHCFNRLPPHFLRPLNELALAKRCVHCFGAGQAMRATQIHDS